MQEHWTCPNCNSDLTYSINKHFQDELVIHCADCDAWFGAETGIPICTAECGGDDEYDEDGIDTPKHQQWLTDTTNQLVNRWLQETRGLPITLQLTKLGFAVINGLEAAYKAGLEAGAKKITRDNPP